MFSKSRIRLSRHLHTQITPYPEANRWFRRGAVLTILIVVGAIYALAKKTAPNETQTPSKQILGEQEKAVPLEYESYLVKKGDTLFNLSQRFDVSWQTLTKLNNLEEPYLLKIGQKLKIPKTLVPHN